MYTASAAHGQPTAAKCANAILHHRRIAVDDRGVIHAHAQFVGGYLRERSFLALAMRRSASQES